MVSIIKQFFKDFDEKKKTAQTTIVDDLDEGSIQSCVGLVCSVLTINNVCYFDGRIETFYPDRPALRIRALRTEVIPTVFNSPVKISVQSGSSISIFHGIVKEQDKGFWIIDLVNLSQYENHRDSFRQVLNGIGIVSKKTDGEPVVGNCKLVDISLTGICFSSDLVFEVGDHVTLSEAYLYQDALLPYTFHCEIRRSFKRPGLKEEEDTEDRTYYGCSFERLSSTQESRLFRDIFFLQKRERNG